MKTALKGVVGVVVGMFVVGAGVYGWASMKDRALLARTIEAHTVDFPTPFPLTEADRAAATEEATATGGSADSLDFDAIALEREVDRGRHLTEARYACRECHGKNFGGGVMVDDPMIGKLLGPNITAGPGGRTADFQASEWDRIVRHGVRSDGHPAVMPSEEFRSMSDQELADIVAFVRSQPVVNATVPQRKLGPLGTVLVAFGKIPLATDLISDHNAAHPVMPPQAEASADFGQHLAGTCSGCHRSTFSGGLIPGGDPSWPPAANLMPAGNLTGWTLDQFATLLRTGKRPDGTEVRVPMTIIMGYGQNMTDTEISALFAFLQSLPPTLTAN